MIDVSESRPISLDGRCDDIGTLLDCCWITSRRVHCGFTTSLVRGPSWISIEEFIHRTFAEDRYHLPSRNRPQAAVKGSLNRLLGEAMWDISRYWEGFFIYHVELEPGTGARSELVEDKNELVASRLSLGLPAQDARTSAPSHAGV